MLSRKVLIITHSILIIAFLFSWSYFSNKPIVPLETNTLDDLTNALNENLLASWYPVSLDTVYGGFLPDLDKEWIADGTQDKMIVNQARHLWTTSRAFQFTEDSVYLIYSSHAFDFMYNKMWDEKHGGFHQIMTREGHNKKDSGFSDKTAYGNAFGLYGLASYYKASGNPKALDLAIETFRWLEKFAYDSLYGGYYDHFLVNGERYSMDNCSADKSLIQKKNWKDYNSSIHLLEAFTELYSIWPDSLLRERLQEMLHIVRDIMVYPNAYLQLYWTGDWKHISYADSSRSSHKKNFFYDHVSFGHDVETAYLMLEASQLLDAEINKTTKKVAKKMVDHALEHGWDKKSGGFYESGYYYPGRVKITLENKSKIWWSQAEGLNTLLLMSRQYPEDKTYLDAYLIQWHYINQYLIDHKNGGWFMKGTDQDPGAKNEPKGSIWKTNYHDGRALMNCIELLEK